MVEQKPTGQAIYSDIPYASMITEGLTIVGAENQEELDEALAANETKFADRITIGTHSGAFHSDEVLATAMLLYTEAYGKTKPLIVRTRN